MSRPYRNPIFWLVLIALVPAGAWLRLNWSLQAFAVIVGLFAFVVSLSLLAAFWSKRSAERFEQEEREQMIAAANRQCVLEAQARFSQRRERVAR